MQICDLKFIYPVIDETKLVVLGHSLVEGNSIPTNKDKRFSYLLCKDLGLDNTIILGQGGATINSVIQRVSTQLGLLRNVKYALLCIGGNDADSENNASKLNTLNNLLESMGVRTIWLTISPKVIEGEYRPILNAYIKANFEYIDVNQVFYLEDGITIDTSMYVDNVHYSVEGHERVYNLIKAKCQYLYCL